MELSALAGNHRIKEQLSQREQGRGISHAYILSGPPGSGRHTLARLLAAGMLCTSDGEHPCGQCAACTKVRKGVHPDVSVVSGPGEGKPIAVDQVRALRSDAYIRPNEGQRKVYLLELADQMNASAQNAMLKLLEEGPAYAAFLLLANNAGGLLQTVRSRCEELALSPVAPGECERWLKGRFPERSPQQLHTAAWECQGVLGRAIEKLEDEGARRERSQTVQRLAGALERASELELLEAAMVLDKKGQREETFAILSALEQELAARAVRGGDRRRLLRAAQLVRRLNAAAHSNVSGGQLSGWMCAGMFALD